MFKLLLFLLPILPLFSQSISEGDSLIDKNLIQYVDQWDNQKSLPESTKLIIFTSDMEGSKIAHPVLEKKTNDFLLSKNIYFVSDIHKMPFLITKFVALPKMRGYSYTMHLIKDENRGDRFGKEKGKLKLFYINKYIVKKIETISGIEELEIALQNLP